MIEGLSFSHQDWLKRYYRTKKCTCVSSSSFLQVDHDIIIGTQGDDLKVMDHKTIKTLFCELCGGVKDK